MQRHRDSCNRVTTRILSETEQIVAKAIAQNIAKRGGRLVVGLAGDLSSGKRKARLSRNGLGNTAA